ncbi:MAG: hypothetical protein VKI81_12285, partial [Synechococcaceae cyanobacterium]|nr:hypothetical protein [Synechococcaceae cyanobacterium]
LRHPPLRADWRRLAEFALWFLLLLPIYRWRTLRVAFRRAGWPYVAITTGLIALTLIGQIVGLSKVTYPFVWWGMYTRSKGRDPEIWRFEAVSTDGRRESLARSGMTLGPRQINPHLRAALKADPPDLERYERIVDRLIRARRRFSGMAVARVEALRCSLPISSGAGRSGIRCSLVRATDVRP